MLMVLVLMKYAGISQTASDSSSTSIPNNQLRKAINVIEYGKVVSKELSLANQKTALQDSLLKSKDSTIVEFKKKDSTSQLMINAYKEANKNLSMVNVNQELKFASVSSKLSAEKPKKWVFLGIGLLFGFLIGK